MQSSLKLDNPFVCRQSALSSLTSQPQLCSIAYCGIIPQKLIHAIKLLAMAWEQTKIPGGWLQIFLASLIARGGRLAHLFTDQVPSLLSESSAQAYLVLSSRPLFDLMPEFSSLSEVASQRLVP
ncbi:hypothetical protein RRG08_021424 [Elysia crispata]|uniref:Uncharacterized protein n=1 Tax=Elysia crispata TaxID=231223 RepID=A0AAE1A5Q5_9GAST|nr:hypothetical protein RRG08_021424 [Elysia crispata]